MVLPGLHEGAAVVRVGGEVEVGAAVIVVMVQQLPLLQLLQVLLTQAIVVLQLLLP